MDLAIHLAVVQFPINHSCELGVRGSSFNFYFFVRVFVVFGSKIWCLLQRKRVFFLMWWWGGGELADRLTSSCEKLNHESQIVTVRLRRSFQSKHFSEALLLSFLYSKFLKIGSSSLMPLLWSSLLSSPLGDAMEILHLGYWRSP